jgi:hypothetical protein
VSNFSKEIETSNAGKIIKYKDNKSFIEAVDVLLHNNLYFRNNALMLSNKYYYKNIYHTLFNI